MNKARRFESSRYGFESLGKNKSRRLKVKRDRFESSSYGFESLLGKIQISLRRFEFTTQRFESLMAQNSNLTHAIRIPYTAIRIPYGTEFRSDSCDSNPLHSDSNPSWRRIQIWLRRFESPKQRFESLVLQKH